MKNFFYSPLIKQKSHSTRLAYMAVMTALSVVANSWLEVRMFDMQFSFTMVVSVLCGLVLGGGCGFAVCFVADAIGFIINSLGQLYMPWVGISTGCFALISGLIFHNGKENSGVTVIVKTAVICALSFLVCTVGINSTGFYFYNKAMGFSTAVLNYVNEFFGGNVSFIAYLFYRLIFKGQIWVSVVNYVLLFAVLPIFACTGLTKDGTYKEKEKQ